MGIVLHRNLIVRKKKKKETETNKTHKISRNPMISMLNLNINLFGTHLIMTHLPYCGLWIVLQNMKAHSEEIVIQNAAAAVTVQNSSPKRAR